MARYFLSVIFFILLTKSINGFKYCKTDAECTSLSGSICKDNFCECDRGLVLSTDGTKCLPISIQLIGDCVDDRQCSAWMTGPATCKDKHCRCQDGFRYFRTECIPATFVDSDCTTDKDCNNGLFSQDTMKCDGNKCVCNDGYYQKNEYCRLIAKENETCIINEDCVDGLSCMGPDGNKHCQKNEVKSRYSGIPEIEPRAEKVIPCNTNNDCNSKEDMKNSFCDVKHQICLCKPGYVQKKQKCVLDIGETCTDNQECVSAICKSGVCQCNDYWSYGYMNEKCIKPFYSQHCSADSSCQVVFGRYSECASSKCVCVHGYKISDDGICVQDSSGSDASCSEENQGCKIPNTVCNTTIGFCVCKDNYRNKKGVCVPVLGGECDAKMKCDVPTMECKTQENDKKTCQCLPDYVPINPTTCLKEVTNITTDECVGDVQCHKILGKVGICNDKKCQCPSDYKQEENEEKYTCMKKRYFGDYCTTLNECKVMLNDDNVQCRNNHCVCNYGFEMNKEEMKCDYNAAGGFYTSIILIISSIMTSVIL